MTAQATVVIPQFNHAELTCNCLKSLELNESCPLEVIVVDDGSSARCREQVESLNAAGARVIAQSHLGVSAAWNCGAAAATSPFLIFLNNDTILSGPVAERLLAPLKAGSALMTGVRMRRECALPRFVLKRLPTDRFLEGWCVAVSRSDFLRMKGFDESMALYWSDTDFQARLLRDGEATQLQLASVPDLPIRHRSHGTAKDLPARRKIWQTDRETFIRKWMSL